jgi:hypothetical protein
MPDRLCGNCKRYPPEPKNTFCSICISHWRGEHEAANFARALQIYQPGHLHHKDFCRVCNIRLLKVEHFPEGYCDICVSMFVALFRSPYFRALERRQAL